MRFLRLLLLPFSFIYAAIVSFRNLLFSTGLKESWPIPGKSVCIGNIAVGGTGKSPMTIYIAELLLEKGMEVAILSRGYGRKTQGLRIASAEDSATTIGDEPFMYYKRFAHQNVLVVVSEERKAGVILIRSTHPEAVILLDDAFQHRKVKAGLQLVLTTFDKPLFRDFVFPAGNLREPRNGLKRADAVIVTKSPDAIGEAVKSTYTSHLGRKRNEVFFSGIVYGELKSLGSASPPETGSALLVSGIANPKPLYDHLRKSFQTELMQFPDHHAFTSADLDQIQRKIDTFASRQPTIVTTEKDAVRLIDLQEHPAMRNNSWYFQSMTVRFDREQDFNELILKYVTGTDERSS